MLREWEYFWFQLYIQVSHHLQGPASLNPVICRIRGRKTYPVHFLLTVINLSSSVQGSHGRCRFVLDYLLSSSLKYVPFPKSNVTLLGLISLRENNFCTSLENCFFGLVYWLYVVLTSLTTSKKPLIKTKFQRLTFLQITKQDYRNKKHVRKWFSHLCKLSYRKSSIFCYKCNMFLEVDENM